MMPGSAPISSTKRRHQVLGGQHPAAEEHEDRKQGETEQRDAEGGELGEHVVEAADRPAEVERQDVVAHVVDDQLGRLGGQEDGQQRADAPQVVLVAVELDDVTDQDA